MISCAFIVERFILRCSRYLACSGRLLLVVLEERFQGGSVVLSWLYDCSAWIFSTQNFLKLIGVCQHLWFCLSYMFLSQGSELFFISWMKTGLNFRILAIAPKLQCSIIETLRLEIASKIIWSNR